ncbi:unnamed protein product [Vitrella brassicaformis CCMP3155]|uniref:PH domain-containing protein n=2 Tax=Vitrella brassicaformis TaxID=1169539 RepID=A0A0G4EK53_VITBC|nr:unnamed protein product [Vitrella brassicaformis CCMP3155]|eukprot:CEL96934.1 unnamed protein product [Vitrella brassicaformis CCMP3155]
MTHNHKRDSPSSPARQRSLSPPASLRRSRISSPILSIHQQSRPGPLHRLHESTTGVRSGAVVKKGLFDGLQGAAAEASGSLTPKSDHGGRARTRSSLGMGRSDELRRHGRPSAPLLAPTPLNTSRYHCQLAMPVSANTSQRKKGVNRTLAFENLSPSMPSVPLSGHPSMQLKDAASPYRSSADRHGAAGSRTVTLRNVCVAAPALGVDGCPRCAQLIARIRCVEAENELLKAQLELREIQVRASPAVPAPESDVIESLPPSRHWTRPASPSVPSRTLPPQGSLSLRTPAASTLTTVPQPLFHMGRVRAAHDQGSGEATGLRGLGEVQHDSAEAPSVHPAADGHEEEDEEQLSGLPTTRRHTATPPSHAVFPPPTHHQPHHRLPEDERNRMLETIERFVEAGGENEADKSTAGGEKGRGVSGEERELETGMVHVVESADKSTIASMTLTTAAIRISGAAQEADKGDQDAPPRIFPLSSAARVEMAAESRQFTVHFKPTTPSLPPLTILCSTERRAAMWADVIREQIGHQSDATSGQPGEERQAADTTTPPLKVSDTPVGETPAEESADGGQSPVPEVKPFVPPPAAKSATAFPSLSVAPYQHQQQQHYPVVRPRPSGASFLPGYCNVPSTRARYLGSIRPPLTPPHPSASLSPYRPIFASPFPRPASPFPPVRHPFSSVVVPDWPSASVQTRDGQTAGGGGNVGSGCSREGEVGVGEGFRFDPDSVCVDEGGEAGVGQREGDN